MTPPGLSTDEEIATVGRGLLACSLPRAYWTHAAHFAATLWLLDQQSGPEVARQLPDIIRRYNEATGTSNTDHSGYHETITRASLHVARLYAVPDSDRPVSERLHRLLTFPYGQAGWLLAHWSPERLFSPQARRVWVAPDRQPLPTAPCEA